jgi:hypothetical protein
MQQEPAPAAEPTADDLFSLLDNKNLFDVFYPVDAYISMKSSEIKREIEESADKAGWYLFFLELSAVAAKELYFTYYYYRNIYLPNALGARQRLEDDSKTSKFRESLDAKNVEVILPDSLDRIVDELVYAGYISINHKAEDILRYIESHSSGNPYGQIPVAFESLYDYSSLLKTEFGFELYKFFTEYIPRLQLIRNLANSIKHTNGYPNPTANDKFGASDRRLLQLIGREETDRTRITRTSDEFIDDAKYAVLAVNFFFKFVKKIHKTFLLIIEPAKEKPEFTPMKQTEVDKLRRMCDLIKNAASDEYRFNRLIGYTYPIEAASAAE